MGLFRLLASHRMKHSHENGQSRSENSNSPGIKNTTSTNWTRATSMLDIKPWSTRPRSRGHDTEHALRHRSRRINDFLRYVIKSSTLLLALFLTLSVWNCLRNSSYADPPTRYQSLEKLVKSSATPGRGNVNHEKVFIAANIVNERMIRGVWGESLISLVDLLGQDNVFVSIYENDSGNGTSQALRQLQQRLKCNSSVVAGDHISLLDFPQTRLPNGEERVQRLTYLAEIRNRLLRPIDPLYQDNSTVGFRKAPNIKFDKILFLNDVYYSPLEAVQLLFSTNAASGSAQYRAVCAIDFVQLFKLYDTFVVRDTEGYRVALQYFPWFTKRGSGASRRDTLNLSDAVGVRSCWGGMAAFDASVFQPTLRRSQTNPFEAEEQAPIKFRSNQEPFWEAAECCLIFADMETKLDQPTQLDRTGVFINPYIRTAYSARTWSWLPFFKRYERFFQYYQRVVDIFMPPESNPRRTHNPGQMVNEVVWISSTNATKPKANPHYRNYAKISTHGHFEVRHRPAAAGGFCGQRRMFVMKQDIESANQRGNGKNWESVHIPWHFELDDP